MTYRLYSGTNIYIPKYREPIDMKLLGDPQGIEELKFFRDSEDKKEYLKMILNEAKTNTDFKTRFKDRNSQNHYVLTYDPATGDFNVAKA